jgi:hypothetical protein
MPRFFFHVHKEGLTLGAVEEELPDRSMALPTARAVARELLADIEGGWSLARIDVTDDRTPSEWLRDWSASSSQHVQLAQRS